MSFQGIETFQLDVGQFFETRFSTDNQGTLTFVSGQGVVSDPGVGGPYSGTWLYINSGGVPPSAAYVAIDTVGWTASGSPSYISFNPGFYKDGNNFVFADNGPDFSHPGSFGIRLGVGIGGIKQYNSPTAPIFASPLPFRKAIAINGKFLEFWVFVSGAWTQLQTWDCSAIFDMTQPGAMNGFKAGFSLWNDAAAGNVTATVANLQWGPYSDLTKPYLPPANLTGSQAPGEVLLTWTASIPVASGGGPPYGYAIFRGGVQIGTSTVTNFVDTNVTIGSTYVYTVEAIDSGGAAASALSNPLSITISSGQVILTTPFVFADSYKPVMLANVKGIKPRIWVPSQNNVVRTKQ